MLPNWLLKDRFWVLLAMVSLVVAWSLPVVAQALYAKSQPVFSLAFAVAWAGIMAGLGLYFYGVARKNSQVASLAIVLSVATLTLLYRVPLNFVQPQFMAEDACIFFVQQRELGWHAFITPYNGYYHTVVRLIAAVVAHLPLLFSPAFYNLAWLGIYSFVVAYILLQYPERKLAPVMALVTAFIAHNGEIFLVATDTIWLGGLFLISLLLLPVPDLKSWARYGLAGILLLFAVSGPFSLALAPFYGLRWLMSRKGFPIVYVIAVVLGAIIQMTALHDYYAQQPPGVPVTLSTLWLSLEIAVVRVPWSLMAGYQPQESYWLIGLVFFAVLVGYMAREIVMDFQKHLFPIACLVLSTVFVVLSVRRIAPLENLLPLVNGDRYFYLPKVLLAWALIHFAATAREARPFYLALFFCAFGSIAEFTNTQKTVDYDWPHYAALIEQDVKVQLPVNPPGWSTTVNNHVPAARLNQVK